jgi:hypothetical protein
LLYQNIFAIFVGMFEDFQAQALATNIIHNGPRTRHRFDVSSLHFFVNNLNALVIALNHTNISHHVIATFPAPFQKSFCCGDIFVLSNQ